MYTGQMHCEKIRASREAPAYMYTYALVIIIIINFSVVLNKNDIW